jgi:hypothetical protein
MSVNRGMQPPHWEDAVVAGKGTADVRLSLRVPRDLNRRVESLVPKIAKDRAVATFGKVTQSTVLKLALLRGLDALEQEYK